MRVRRAINLNRACPIPRVSPGSRRADHLGFQGVAKGSTTVTIPNLLVRNAQGQPIFSGSPQMTINVK